MCHKRGNSSIRDMFIYGTSAHHTKRENVRMQKDKCLWPLTFICNLQSSTHRKKSRRKRLSGLGLKAYKFPLMR